MVARLGSILYWLGCIVAVLLLALGALVWFNRTHAGDVATVLMLAFSAAIVWLIARACRYVLAGT